MVNAIHRTRLFDLLNLNLKLNQEKELIFRDVNCPDYNGETVVVSDVIVKKFRPGVLEHRVFVVCPKCVKMIPFGRYHQHAGAKSCTVSRNKKLLTPLAVGINNGQSN